MKFNEINQNKVVDEHGNPLVVYHGTKNKIFTEFDIEKSLGGGGIWFTTNKMIAYGYTTGIDRKGRTTYGRIFSAHLIINNPAKDGNEYNNVVDASGNKYDGIISNGTYIVFNTNQIEILSIENSIEFIKSHR